MQMSGRKIKNENIKGRGEVKITLISALGSHKYGVRKSIVSLKDTKNNMA